MPGIELKGFLYARQTFPQSYIPSPYFCLIDSFEVALELTRFDWLGVFYSIAPGSPVKGLREGATIPG